MRFFCLWRRWKLCERGMVVSVARWRDDRLRDLTPGSLALSPCPTVLMARGCHWKLFRRASVPLEQVANLYLGLISHKQLSLALSPTFEVFFFFFYFPPVFIIFCSDSLETSEVLWYRTSPPLSKPFISIFKALKAAKHKYLLRETVFVKPVLWAGR